MTIDPAILSIFGEPPDGIDLSNSLVVRYNIIVLVIFGLAVGFVALRIYVRVSRSFLWYDDYAIMLSVVSCRPRPTREQRETVGSPASL